MISIRYWAQRADYDVTDYPPTSAGEAVRIDTDYKRQETATRSDVSCAELAGVIERFFAQDHCGVISSVIDGARAS